MLNSRFTLSIAVAGVLSLSTALDAQTSKNPLKYAAKPTVAAITPADLMSRLYVFADDSMMGREVGSPYHDKGVEYIARELTRLGLRPAGQNATFFQPIPLIVHTPLPDTKVIVDGREFAMGRDFLPRDPGDFGAAARDVQNAPAVYGGMFPDTANMIRPDQADGKVLVFSVPRGWQANRGFLVFRYQSAAGIVIATLDSMPAEVRTGLAQPSTIMGAAAYAGKKCNPATLTACPVGAFFYSTRAMADAMLGGPVGSTPVGVPGKAVSLSFRYSDATVPGSRNVVAVLPGSDPTLAGQYVAIGSHSDHVGFTPEPVDHDSLYAFYHVVRPGGADDENKQATDGDWPRIRAKLDSLRKSHPARVDSINNGADDDGSGSMGMLEVAEALVTSRDKPKRSILFVWHVGEEAGLWGSAFFTDYPTVPRDSIVAQINIDMIGRGGAQDTPGGGPGYLQLIGSKRLSTELGNLVEAEGKKFTPAFRYDYQFDANGHPQQYYCRSDHYNYARYGIPVVFMSTGGHAEYHQVTDEPQYIDYDQLARVSQLVLNVAKSVANLDHRVVVDKPKPDPNGNCVQ